MLILILIVDDDDDDDHHHPPHKNALGLFSKTITSAGIPCLNTLENQHGTQSHEGV